MSLTKWYKIGICPNYAISDDGEVMNLKTGYILTHKSCPNAKDGKRRVTLYRKPPKHTMNVIKQVFTIEYLQEQYVKPGNEL